MKIFSKLSAFFGSKRPKGKKMRASVARRSLRAATADYEEMGEPNMKLSRALLIVLLLHVVAVSGIIAFNAIKTRQGAALPRIKASPTSAVKSDSTAATSDTGAVKGAAMEIRPARAVGKPNDKAAESSRHDAGHKTYTVAKGDNPASIARKFKVSYDDLLALNHIDDPRKLKIGQKMLIPNKNTTGKKGTE